MVFWRGLGFLGFILMALGAVAFAGIATAIDGPLQVLTGIGLVVGGGLTFALGWLINVVMPARQTEEWAGSRQQELDQYVQSGRFQLAPGAPLPGSLAEAQAQAAHLLESEKAQVGKLSRNRHGLYFMPLQWAGVVGVCLGLIIALFGAF